MGWIFLIALEDKMDSSLADATLVHNVQRRLEELEQSILVLQQEPHGPEEPSLSGSVWVMGDKEHYEISGSCLPARP